MKRKTRQKITLSVLFVVGLYGAFAGSNEPILPFLKETAIAPVLYRLHLGNSIVFNLSIGILVSLLFWFLLVGIPQANRRHIIKTNLQRQYLEFKRNVIQILIWSADSAVDTFKVEQLLDHSRFKAYFKDNESERWYAAMNGLQKNSLRLQELIAEIEIFSQEISYTLNNVEFEDHDAFVFFRHMQSYLFRFRDEYHFRLMTDGEKYDQVKALGRFVWEILARWSFAGGQAQEDVIQKTIDDI